MSVIYRCLLFLICGIVAIDSYGEKLPFKLGKVSMEEMKMTECNFYPDATSMTLSEYGIIKFAYSNDFGWQYKMDVAVRKKIFSITDAADAGNVKIRIYKPTKGFAKEDIQGLKAYCHNLVNGKIEKTKLNNKEYFERRISDNWVEISFAIPGIKAGSVIEYSYTKVSDYLNNLTTWYFQQDIPVAHSEIRFTIPQYFDYQISQVGTVFKADRLQENRQEQFTYRWSRQGMGGKKEEGTGTLDSNSKYQRLAANQITPLEDEPYMNNRSDVISRLQFQLMSIRMPNQPIKYIAGNYDKFNKDLVARASFGDRIKGANFLKDLKEKAMSKEPMERASFVHEHISNKMSWNGRYTFLSSKAGRPAYNAGEGNVAAINLTLVAAYKEMGLKSYPVILSTRGHGTVHPVFPSWDEFNYVIAAVELDGKYYFSDATGDLSFGQLPLRCRNGQGWMVGESQGQWVNLKVDSQFSEIVMMKTDISDGQISTHVTDRKIGYAALDVINKIESESEEDYQASLMAEFENYELSNMKIEETSVNKPVTMDFDIVKELDDEDILYIQPITLGSIFSNPFRREERKSVIDMPYAQSYKVYATINLPEGFEAQLPKAARVQLPEKGGTFLYSCVQNGNTINVVSQVNLSKTDFMPEEYASLKQFYQMIVDKNEEFIVLTKK